MQKRASTKAKSGKKDAKPAGRAKKAAAAPPKRVKITLRCPNCRVDLKKVGEMNLREGGSGGGTNFLFGDLTAIDEDLWPVEQYRCPRCRVITLREPRG